jgi:thymidylate synthase
MREYLKISLIEAHNLPEAWFLCLREVLKEGYEYVVDRGSFAGQKRKELDFVVIKILHPIMRPLAPTVPPGIPPPTSEEFIENYLNYLLTSEKAPDQAYTYGEDLEDTIWEVIRMYKEEGFNTNQACLSIGSRHSIFLKDPQCLRVIDTRIRYGKLHFVVYFRSWDLYGGFPTNLGGLQLLKEWMAEEIKVKDGELIAISKGLHLYEHHWELAKMCAKLD